MSAKKHQRGGSRPATSTSGTDGGSSMTGRSAVKTSKSRTAMVGGLAFGLTATVLVGVPAAQAINSNPPTGPGNIEIFPMRDMVAIEGYTEQAGKTATITATRDGQVIGRTVGTVGADGFLEANHPGGVCWGEGSGSPQVTPDLRANDQIKVEFSTGEWDGSSVVDVEAVDVVLDEVAHTLTINGRYGPGVDMPGTDLTTDPGKFAIEIVNPDMRNGSAIGARAISWPGHAPDPLDPEPVGGYTVDGSVSGTDAGGGTFQAVFDFESAEDLELANAGSITALGWHADHPDPNQEAQYGLTLNEFYEFGGPGMGGCPAGPQEVRTNGPETYSAKGAGAGSIQVDWKDAVATPGTPAVNGYTVRAVAPNGVDLIGKRLPNTAAAEETTTLTGLVANQIYSIEIAAKSSAGEGTPSVISRVKAAAHIVPTATANTLRKPNADGKYQPLVTTTNGDFGVTLDPVAGLTPTAEIHYTTDGSTPTLTNSRTFVPGVSSSIQIRQDTTVRWFVKDSGNIVGPTGEKFFDIVESTNPAPVITKAAPAATSGTVEVTFTKPVDTTEPVNGFRLQAYTASSTDAATGVRVGDPVATAYPLTADDPAALDAMRRMGGLTNGTEYKFSVAARYGTVWSNESALSDVVAPLAAASANAGPDQSVLRGRTATLDGSGSSRVTSYRWTQVRPRITNPDGTTYQDPLLTLSDATAVKPTFRFPTKSSFKSDDNTFEFRLVTTHTNADGTTFTRGDNVVVTQQPDAVAATRTRWRAGDTLVGTGTQENATLRFHHTSHTGTLVATAVVTNGQWTVPGTNTQPPGGKFYVWSDFGYVGTITVTN